MKQKLLLLFVVAGGALYGCGDAGVPEVADPHHIVVDGKPMTGPEFVAKYCAGQATQKTCDAVRMAVSQDAGHRPVAKGW